MDLQLDVADVGPVSVLSVGGELDIASAPGLRDQLAELDRPGPRLVVVDLSDVPFMDSTGLSVLVTAKKRLERSDIALALVITKPLPRKLLRVTGLDQWFSVHATVADAVRALPRPG